MDLRMLRELELDAVVRLYGGGEELASPAPPGPPCRTLFVEGCDWLVVAGAGAGDPFSGAPGKLLDAMLAAAGGQRSAEPSAGLAEALSTRPPRLVLLMGPDAAREALPGETDFASLRSRVHACRGVPAIVTFDAGHLLEASLDKPGAWEDLVLARRTLAAAPR